MWRGVFPTQEFSAQLAIMTPCVFRAYDTSLWLFFLTSSRNCSLWNTFARSCNECQQQIRWKGKKQEDSCASVWVSRPYAIDNDTFRDVPSALATVTWFTCPVSVSSSSCFKAFWWRSKVKSTRFSRSFSRRLVSTRSIKFSFFLRQQWLIQSATRENTQEKW